MKRRFFACSGEICNARIPPVEKIFPARGEQIPIRCVIMGVITKEMNKCRI